MRSDNGNKKAASSKLKVDKSKLVELTSQDVEQVAGGAVANSGPAVPVIVGGGGNGGIGTPGKTKVQVNACVK